MRGVLNNKVVLFTIGVLLLANIAMLTFFLWFDKPAKALQPEGSRAVIARFLTTKIGFGPEQMESYQALRDRHRKIMKPLFEDMRITKIAFFSLLHTPGTADSTINRSPLLIGEKQKNIDLQTFRNFQELRNLCTAEQKLRFDSLLPGVINKMWFAPKTTSARLKPDKHK